MRARPFRWRRLAPLLLLGTLGCFSRCGSAGNPCASRAVCAEEGQCHASQYLAGDGAYRCYVRDADDCRASEACRSEGRCEYDPRVSLRCISPERVPPSPPPIASVCERSSDCARWGRCALIEGACMAEREEDCARSLECVVRGRCSLRGNDCGADSDADCGGSLECDLYGRCVQDRHPLLGASAVCTAPERHPPPSCIYDGAGADRCAQTGECLTAEDGRCETLEHHGRSSPALDDARRRLREATPVDRPPSMR